MNLKNKILLLFSATILLYSGFYIFNLNATPKIKTTGAKYSSTESLEDLESESELIVRAIKVEEENKIVVTPSTSDPNIKYEDPVTLSTFKIEEIYYDQTNTFHESDKFVVEEFAGYTTNFLTGSKTLITPEEYTLTKQDNSYILFLRKSKSSPGNYIIFANHFGKFTFNSSEKTSIINKFNEKDSSVYQKIENDVLEKYK